MVISESTELDNSGALATLHNLYTLTVTPAGRDALVRVFSADYNIKSLLPFVELTGKCMIKTNWLISALALVPKL